MNEQASAWWRAVDGLSAVHDRIRRVAILNEPALKVLRHYDGPDALFYLDPPYSHDTRASTKVYEYEMTEKDHRELLDILRTMKGKAMLSGYPSALYDQALADWNRHTFNLPNNAAGGAVKRRMVETLWCNF
jgi:DNA adenine methylase